MAEADGRETLARLAAERGDDLSALSRLIGRNPAYVQQYIRRGTPRRLAEEDRRTLALYFGVPEEALGGRAPEPAAAAHLPVPRLDVRASAGLGAVVGEERAVSHLAFDPAWLRRIGASDGTALSIIRVEGDSMAPTLADGDEILVDRADGGERLRDGIYVLRRDDSLLVKRLSPSPAGDRVSVLSDNQDYRSWPDLPVASIEVVGRVVWCGRTFT
jgi:phage repressor protein C with HTH and peptisase S24 domain